MESYQVIVGMTVYQVLKNGDVKKGKVILVERLRYGLHKRFKIKWWDHKTSYVYSRQIRRTDPRLIKNKKKSSIV